MSAKSLGRPVARLFVIRSDRPITGKETSPMVTITLFFHAVAKSNPLTTVRRSMRPGGTPI